jgi:hypothetical protein
LLISSCRALNGVYSANGLENLGISKRLKFQGVDMRFSSSVERSGIRVFIVYMWAPMLSFFVSGVAGAQYNDNITGSVIQIVGYADSDQILIRLGNQPVSHPGCNAEYFSIGGDISDRRRIPMLNLLILAKLTGDSITIGFDNAGNCSDGYIRVHRVG